MKHSDQLLVGSVSLPSARELFSSCCDAIGDNLERIRIAEKYFPEFGTSYVC